MAIQETIQVNVQSNLAQEEKHAQGIHSQLRAAANVRMSGQTPARMAAANPDGTASPTNLSRGIAGQTGASGRDFAAQAQGLGGLVHVYATFAANLFAVTAAFTALSKAADTTNLIKGLDQLGAASGRALGGLAKSMTIAADGALSLRDAMSSAALASSAGMNNTNILRMTEVAKKASQALGRDMADSMDRLTKGIAKTQPELLDELGIMARVIPAQEAYARQIGKTVSSLTDLEKKQAFANAVLEEGERKFSAIDIDANAYSQLSASLINALQSGLELLNKVLMPIASILASSPTALVAAMAAVGAVLLKQALPALGQFKEGMQASADLATSIANKRSVAANASRKADFENLKQALDNEAEVRVAAVVKAEADARKIAAASSFKPSKGVQKILDKDLGDINQKDFAKIESVALAQETRGRTALAQAYRDLSVAIKQAQVANANFDKEVAAARIRLQEQQKAITTTGQVQIIADRANQAARTRSIASLAAETGATNGLMAAYRQLRQEIKTAQSGSITKDIMDGTTKLGEITVPAMSRVRGAWTLFSGSVAAAGGAISTFLNFAGPWLQAIGLAITAFSFLSDYLSKNTKAAAETQTAFDQLGEASKTTVNVFERLQGLDPLERLSTQNISAKSTAVTEAASSIENAFKKITKQTEEANLFDNLVDQAKAKVGLGLIAQTSTELANATANSLRLAKGTKAGAEATKQLAAALKIDPNDKEALKSVLGESQEKFFKLGPQVVQIMKTLGVELTKSSSAAQNFDAAVATASKTFDDLLISMLPTDITAKIGFQFIDMGKTITDALKDPAKAMQTLSDIAKDNQKLRLFSPEFAVELAKNNKDIQESSERLAKYQQGIKDQQAYIDTLIVEERPLIRAAKGSGGRGNYSASKDLLKNRAAQEQAGQDIRQLEDLSKPLEQSLAPFIEKFRDEEIKAFARGAELVQASIGDGFAKAAVTISKAYAEGLGGTIGGLQERARLDKINIDIQLRQIKASQSLADITDKLALVTEERLIFDREQSILSKIDAVGGPTDAQGKEYRFVLSDKAGLELAKELAGKVNLSQITQLLKGTADAKLLAGRTVEEGKAAAKFLLPGAQRKAAANSQVAGLTAQKEAIDIGLDFQKIQQIAAIEKDRLATEESGLTVEKATIDIRAKNALYLDSELLALKKQNEEAIAKNKNAQENLSIQLEIDKANKSLEAARTEMSRKQKPEASNKSYEAEQNALSALAELEAKQANATKRQDDDAKKRLLGTAQDGIAAEKARFDLAISNSKAIEADRAAAAQAELTAQDEKLARLTAAGALEQSAIAVLTTQSNINKELERSNAAQYATAIAFAQQQAALQAQKAQEPAGSTAAKNIQAQIDLNQTLYANATTREQQLTAEKIKTLTVQGQMNEMLAKQAEAMTIMNNLTQSLTTVFGEMGANIGKSAETFLKFAQNQESYAKARAELMKDEKKNKLEIEKLDKKNTGSIIKDIGSISAASKKMFGERTNGYKILNAVEKASAAASSVLAAKQLAEQAINAAKSIGIDIPAIYAEFMAQLGPYGAAAAGIAIAAFLGRSSSGPASYTGPSAEDQKKVQGTGMQYQGNTLVDTGLGVLGASDQLSDTLTKTQTLLAENSVKGLEVDKSMLKAINRLVDAIGSAVTTIALEGNLGKGLNFGTLPGETKTPDFLGTSNGFNAVAGAGIGALIGSVVPVIGTAIGGVVGGIIGGLSNSIFGGGTSSSSSIVGAGLQFNGTIKELANGAAGALNQYKDVLIQFHEDGGWFGSDSNWTEMRTQLQGVTAQVSGAIALVFMSVQDVAYAVAKKAGVASKTVDEALKSTRITDKLNLQGLSIEDQNSLLQSVTSKALTQVFEKVLPQFKKFQKAGEDLAATVFRVIDAQDKVNLSLDLVGSKFTHKLGVEFTQTLVAAAGGLQNFVDQANFFAERFNTEAENIALTQKQVTKSMKALGYGTVTTREQFKELVKGISKNLNPKTAELYQKLMDLAPAFDAVASAAEKSAAITYDLQTSLLTAQGYGDAAQSRNRQKTLDALASQSDKSIQQQIYNQEDLNKTNSLNIELLNAEGKSNESLLLTRTQELKALSDSDQLIKKKTYAQQDANKTESLNIELLNAEGKSNESLLLTRTQELKALSDSDQLIKKKTYAQQDANKTESLNIQLLNLQGKSADALILTRARELAALSVTDQAIQKQIYTLQDEATAKQKLAAFNTIEIGIYNLLGKSAEALALQREQELDNTDDALKASKRYQFALEDEKALKEKISAAYTKQKDALKSTITGLDGSIKSLKDFKSSLLTSANTVLTPSQIYQQNKNSFDTLAATASMFITDSSSEADRLARDNALSQLPQAATAFLESSKIMFASGDGFSADFSLVNSILNRTSGVLENQKSTAENQLTALEDSVSFLNLIETNTETTASLLAQLVALSPATEAAKKAAVASGSTAATVPAYASGGLASGISLVGENGPEIVDFKTPGRVYSNRASNDIFNSKQLVEEIRSLRQEVNNLRKDQKEQTGHLITATYDANAQNAEQVTAGTEDALQAQNWKARSQIKFA